MQLYSSDEFISMLDTGIAEDRDSTIEFTDEIVSIKPVGIKRTYDINVTGDDHYFYANGVLTHNSAVNNVDDADNSNVSDSMGTVMTADFMLFMLQNDEMKEAGEMVLKCTKNRFTGMTDTWMMNVDYTKMRFSDMLVKAPTAIDTVLTTTGGSTLDTDFGVVTAEKQEKAEEFANTEVNDIQREDIKKVQEHNKNAANDPFNNDMDELFKDLGI